MLERSAERFHSNRRRIAWISLACFLAMLLALSCSKYPRNARSLVRSALRAHGGKGAVAKLQSYVGKGYIKNLSDTVMAKSDPFDIYRSRVRYKHRMLKLQDGKVTAALVLSYDGEKTYEWESRHGLRSVPAMDLSLLKHRYPVVLSSLTGKQNELVLLPSSHADRELRVKYVEGDLQVVLSFDKKNRLLSGVKISSLVDSLSSFEESYGNYMYLDGIPFPSRFKASYLGRPIYEYLLSKVELGTNLPDSIFSITRSDTAGFAR